jgi:hypothetical protein
MSSKGETLPCSSFSAALISVFIENSELLATAASGPPGPSSGRRPPFRAWRGISRLDRPTQRNHDGAITGASPWT